MLGWRSNRQPDTRRAVALPRPREFCGGDAGESSAARSRQRQTQDTRLRGRSEQDVGPLGVKVADLFGRESGFRDEPRLALGGRDVDGELDS